MADHDFSYGEHDREYNPGSKRSRDPAKLKAHDNIADENNLKETGIPHDTRLIHSVDAGQRAQLIHGLQRTRGNAFVQRFLKSGAIQAKLTINPPDDIYEHEADRVAENVTNPSTSAVQRQAPEEEEVQTKLQLQEEEEEVQTKLQRQVEEEEEEEEVQTKLQRQVEEEEEEVQTKSSSDVVPQISEGLESRIHTARSGGQAVPDSVRNSFEPRFGRDFSQVRLHTDSEADTLSREFQAKAFTTGGDVFFRAGDYNPDTDEGKKLLAHELTHVVQQGAAPVSRKPAEAEK